jgi:hypothetical protein
LIFQGLIVNIVFALVFDLLRGWGCRRWWSLRWWSLRWWSLRSGELNCSRENHGTHYGDGRDPVVGPIKIVQRVPPACFPLLN